MKTGIDNAIDNCEGLNPCYSGICSVKETQSLVCSLQRHVLILVIVEYAL